MAHQNSGLSRQEAEDLAEKIWRSRLSSIAASRVRELEEKCFVIGENKLKYEERVYGDTPEDGHSLWISLHGGGGCPSTVNDEQWRNQICLYKPLEGIYIAPRAPGDTWDLWHQSHVDRLFDRLIETYIAARNVNSKKVYILGYSAGGDGVYKLAPRMADRFAAASMMAGHPNGTTPDGLRNLPFALFMGGQDGAYNRNSEAKDFGSQLQDLRAQDLNGYVHEVHIFPNHGHWMEGDDQIALPWMAQRCRNMWPKRIVWLQGDVPHCNFYWLQVALEETVPGNKVIAVVEDQVIRFECLQPNSITIFLSDHLIDLDNPVEVVLVDGDRETSVYHGLVPRLQKSIEGGLSGRFEPSCAPTAQLTVSK